MLYIYIYIDRYMLIVCYITLHHLTAPLGNPQRQQAEHPRRDQRLYRQARAHILFFCPVLGKRDEQVPTRSLIAH